jgi:hypothetical protein
MKITRENNLKNNYDERKNNNNLGMLLVNKMKRCQVTNMWKWRLERSLGLQNLNIG